MAEFVTIKEARAASGMRLIVAEGVPGPWAEGIRGVLSVKNIPALRGRFEMGADQSDLIEWSAQASVPVIAWNEELPKSNRANFSCRKSGAGTVCRARQYR